MPRQPRLDAPGFVHHVMARGIERREVFRDDRDRERFVERLGELILEAEADLLAWCLLSNHFHLLLRTGRRPLPWVMRRLLTSHSVRFNRRHDRCGHLFQNRYKSIVVEEETYLLELVRYIALNPVRAGVATALDELDRYPWGGHAALVGVKDFPWQDVDGVLERFAPGRREAVALYRNFVFAEWGRGRREDLVGGGLVRSSGGREALSGRRLEDREAFDERILGGGDFVEKVWAMAGLGRVPEVGREWEEVLSEVCAATGVAAEQILSPSRVRSVSDARGLFLRRAADEAALSFTALGHLCGLHPSSVGRAVEARRRASP